MKKKGLTIFIIIVAVAGALLAASVIAGARGAARRGTAADTEFSLPAGTSPLLKALGMGAEKPRKIKGDYIALLHIEGVISAANRTYNQEWLLDTIEELRDDPKNRGIMLFVDSPGGTVYESDEAYLALLDYKDATGRPVYAYFASIAASGGYYIGCAADKIYANRNCLTGSIGVIAGASFDATGLLEKIGVKSTTITAGRNKNMMNYNEPLSDEQRAIMQSVADDAYEQFTGIVAESRSMKAGDVRALADGRIYTARQALANGLIDGIGLLADAEDLFLGTEFDGEDIDFEPFEYEYHYSLWNALGEAASAVANPRAALEGISAGSTGLCYLYRGL